MADKALGTINKRKGPRGGLEGLEMAIKHYGEEIYAGLETFWSSVADFFIDPGEKLQVRKLTLRDQGNPGQILLGRAGPDNVDPTNGTFVRPQTPEVGQNMGHMAWQAYQLDEEQFGERLAQIHCRYQGSGRGSLHLTTSGVERICLTDDGYLDVSGLADDNESIRVIVNGRKGRIDIKWEN